MLGAKLIGVLQNQIASPLVGLLLGPAAVGLYDAVVRLPRFVKSLFGLISSTVFPLASRLRSDNDEGGTGKLAYYGILGAVLVTWPTAIAAAIFSKPILGFWVGTSDWGPLAWAERYVSDHDACRADQFWKLHGAGGSEGDHAAPSPSGDPVDRPIRAFFGFGWSDGSLGVRARQSSRGDADLSVADGGIAQDLNHAPFPVTAVRRDHRNRQPSVGRNDMA